MLVGIGRVLFAVLLSCVPFDSVLGDRDPDEIPASWPMHRGGPLLKGRSASEISPNPELIWTFNTGRSVVSSPSIERGRVFVGSNSGKIHSLDLTSGSELWSFETGEPVEAAPCIVEGVVYVGSSDTFMYALSAKDGKLNWKFESGDKILGGANWSRIPEYPNPLILFGSYDGTLYCLDGKTGQPVWTHETMSYLNGTPAVLPRGVVLIGGCDNFIYMLRLQDGSEIGKIDTGSYIAGSIAVAGNRGYLGHFNNEVISFGIDSKEIEWTYRDRDFPYFSSPGVASDIIVIGGRDRRLHGIDRKNGETVWVFSTRGAIDSSPVVCRNAALFGSKDGRFYAVRLNDGEQIWAYEIGAPMISSPAISGSTAVIGSEDGSVYAFRVAGSQPNAASSTE